MTIKCIKEQLKPCVTVTIQKQDVCDWTHGSDAHQFWHQTEYWVTNIMRLIPKMQKIIYI